MMSWTMNSDNHNNMDAQETFSDNLNTKASTHKNDVSSNLHESVNSGNLVHNQDPDDDKRSDARSDSTDYVLDSDDEKDEVKKHRGTEIKNDEVRETRYTKKTKSDTLTRKLFEYNVSYIPKPKLIKTCSTGDLRMYSKKDLQNRINKTEHRLVKLEDRIHILESIVMANPRQASHEPIIHAEVGFYNCLKIIGLSILIAGIYRY